MNTKMKSTTLILAAMAALTAGGVLAADAHHSKGSKQDKMAAEQTTADAATATATAAPAVATPAQNDQSSRPDAVAEQTATAPAATAASNQAMPAPAGMNMFGGPIYSGEPALEVTAALVKAGGGAEQFSFANALVAMLGEEKVNAELAKLTKQYGKQEVDTFLSGMTMAVGFGLKRATDAGVKLPEPANLSGTDLAKALINAGTAPDSTFWSGYLFDKALSNKIHNQVMADINAKAGVEDDKITHKILNQAMYDVAQELGMKDVKLAALH